MRSTILVLSFFLSGCAVTTLMTMGKSLPTLEGEVGAPGLSATTVIHRDERGIPHIRAVTEADAAYAVGYAHAQDRLFQLEAGRRIMAGRLAEIVGPEVAEMDAFMASLNLKAEAEASLLALDIDTKVALAAYAAGVNAGARSLNGLPLELRLLGMDKWREDWTPADSLGALQLFSWTMSDSWGQELVAWEHRDRLDRDVIDAIFRTEPEGVASDAYWGKLRTAKTGPLTPRFRAFLDTLGDVNAPQASNAWVIGGARSVDGKPILANDTHLHRSLPSPFYVVDVAGGGRQAAGFTVPGLPFVAIGHNGALSWGLTNTSADYVDLAVVKRDGERGYILNGVSKTLEERSVSVKVKDEAARDVVTFHTEIGPVVSELGDSKDLLVMRWTALEIADRSADALRAISAMKTAAEAQTLATIPMAPSFTLTAADTQGDYLTQVLGSIPKRKAHSGRLPYPASEPEHGWDGVLTGLPGERAPKRGYVVTANNAPSVDGKRHPLAAQMNGLFPLPWRAQRVAELIEATPLHNVTSVGVMQMDTLDLHAKARLPELLSGLNPTTDGAKRAMELLSAWDFNATVNSEAPLVWMEFQRQLVKLAVGERLGDQGTQMLLSATDPGDSLIDVAGGLAKLVPDRSATLRQALLNAWDTLILSHGPDSGAWDWGDAHVIRFTHPFADATGKLGLLNAGEFPWPGTNTTVSVGGVSWQDGWETQHIAAMRLIVPMSDPSKAEFILPPGNSGQPSSDNYQDQARAWARGDRLQLWTKDEDVLKHTANTLTLKPE